MSPRKRSKSVSREEILDVALQIVDSEGLSALSMRRLGAEVGIDPMMIHRHVPDKETLLDLTVERMRSGMILGNLPDDPAQLLESIFAEYLRVLREHPNMVPLATRRTDATKISGLEYLVDQGVPVENAVELYQSLAAFTIGYALLGSSPAADQWSGMPADLTERLRDWRDETFRRTLRAIIHTYGLGEK